MPYRNKVLLARTMAVCGTAMSAIAAPPAHAQSSEYAASSPATIHVGCAATAGGAQRAKRPYWRITDALDSSRQLRREGPRRIVIRVAPGICSDNFETQSTGQKTRPPELLPRVLNVPNLTLPGAGIM